MKTQQLLTGITIAIGVGLAGALADAQSPSPSLTSTTPVVISGTRSTDTSEEFDISVFAGTAGYSGNGNSGTYGDGTVLDYRFFNNDTFPNGYASGEAGLISTATADSIRSSSWDLADVWTTNDPNVDPANYTSETLARANGVEGTIDISQLESGSLDFIAGREMNSTGTIALTMTGDGQMDLMEEVVFSERGTPVLIYNSTFLFDNPGLLYDSISYTTELGGNVARYMGVVLDGVEADTAVVPEPTSVAIWSLLGLGLVGFGCYHSRKSLSRC